MNSSETEIRFTENAKEQYANLQKRFRDKLDSFLVEIRNSPTRGTGKVERLKGHGGRRYSRRINEKDRLVYEYFPEENKVNILSCLGHHGDH
ncbi:MAG: type II toxin-antitoxin system YoeB family toxin [Puniceicoccales bacterium]|jgi:toxin YoeB|nr:type II toxin-antitoxin system YoeB family toxin [Puniceicoccales bacterium]